MVDYQNFTHNPGLAGTTTISGYVMSHEENPKPIGNAMEVIYMPSSTPATNPIIPPNSQYYKTSSSAGTGYYSMLVNPTYSPYKILVRTNESTFLDKTVGPFTSISNPVNVYLYRNGEGSILVHVHDEDGVAISDAIIDINASGTSVEPVFIRGVGKPVFEAMWLLQGTYVIAENLEFNGSRVSVSFSAGNRSSPY